MTTTSADPAPAPAVTVTGLLASALLEKAPLLEDILRDVWQSPRGAETERNPDTICELYQLVSAYRTEAGHATAPSEPQPFTRSVTQTIADAILTMPEPASGAWRQAAHGQVWKTGSAREKRNCERCLSPEVL